MNISGIITKLRMPREAAEVALEEAEAARQSVEVALEEAEAAREAAEAEAAELREQLRRLRDRES